MKTIFTDIFFLITLVIIDTIYFTQCHWLLGSLWLMAIGSRLVAIYYSIKSYGYEQQLETTNNLLKLDLIDQKLELINKSLGITKKDTK